MLYHQFLTKLFSDLLAILCQFAGDFTVSLLCPEKKEDLLLSCGPEKTKVTRVSMDAILLCHNFLQSVSAAKPAESSDISMPLS